MAEGIAERRIFAEGLADSARTILQAYFRTALKVDSKAALSPIVTQADREVEEKLRAQIAKTFPDDGIFGEEFSDKPATGDYTWILDPIDGTIAFATGKPLFGTLIALVDKADTPLLGIIDNPILEERWLGINGEATTLNGAPCRVSGVKNIADASLATTSPTLLTEAHAAAAFAKAAEKARIVTYGGDCYNYALLAAGHIDMVIESGLNWWDVAALLPVVRGAGGVVESLDGTPLKNGAESYSIIAAADAALIP